MIDFLVDNPLFLLFLVVAVGYPFGRIKLGGLQFGVATILFAGLAIGAIDEDLRLPEIVYELGLVIFVYTIGLSSGREFVRSARERGASIVVWVISLVLLGAGIAAAASRLANFSPPEAAGLFAGGMTNTPALAGVIDYINERYSGPQLVEMSAEPVVAYSIAYPVAITGTIAAIWLLQRHWNVDYTREALAAHQAGFGGVGVELLSRTARLTNQKFSGITVDALLAEHQWPIVFGRIRRGSHVELVTGATALELDDVITVIGEAKDVDRAVEAIGVLVDERLDVDRSEFDYRRIFVSNPDITGRPLKHLQLPHRFGAIVTRVRRGDFDFLPNGSTVLEQGDRVRVVTRRATMGEVTRYFGDSYRALSEVDVLTFSLGIALGLGLGAIPIPLPGGADLTLGIAGGPLVVALAFGALERTGPLNWTMPYGVNLTLRQFGLILFLAGIGTRAGYAFRDMIGSGHGLILLIAGFVLATVVASVAFWTAVRLLRLPASVAAGMVAGLQTQPAVLSFAHEQSNDPLPDAGYAMVFPFAMIAKIVMAQLLLGTLL